MTSNDWEIKAIEKANQSLDLDDFQKNYVKFHGAHVFEDKPYPGCKLCDQRAGIQVLARMTGVDPEKAVSDAIIARELTGR